MNEKVTEKQLSELFSDHPRIKYRRAKILLEAARKNPRQLLTHFAFFTKLLDSENNILKWTGIDILGYIGTIISKNRVDKLRRTFVGFLQGGKLITANHAIGALARVAQSRSAFQDDVAKQLLKVEYYFYETRECHNIIMGKVIEALSLFLTQIRQNDNVVAFVKRQTANSRPATRKKAEKFLMKFSSPD